MNKYLRDFLTYGFVTPMLDDDGGSSGGGGADDGKPSEGDDGKKAPAEEDDSKKKKDKDPEDKKFSQQDLDEILNKRIGKLKSDFDKKLELAQKEAARLATLSAEERKKEEERIERAKFEQEKLELARDKLAISVRKELANEKALGPIVAAELPDEVIHGLLVLDDADKTLGNMNAFIKAFKKALEVAVNEKLKSKTPGAGGGSKSGGSSEFESSLAEAKNKKAQQGQKTFWGK